MILQNASGELLTIEARSSDAIAMAVRFVCPIYTYELVLASVGFAGESSGGDSLKRGPFSDYPVDELESLPAKLLAKEDYSSAARIRDALNKRKQQ